MAIFRVYIFIFKNQPLCHMFPCKVSKYAGNKCLQNEIIHEMMSVNGMLCFFHFTRDAFLQHVSCFSKTHISEK
jgi:hypothetical protein